MQVQEIMTHEVSCAQPETNAAAAAELMWTNDCGSLPVVEDGRRVIGMVTDRDLFIALGTQNKRASDLTVGEIMRVNPSVCSPRDDLRNALMTMAEDRVHRLPVVDETGALRGILSIDDVIARSDSTLKDQVLRTLEAVCSRPSPEGRAAAQ
jgi:CBS domain-containing protein